MAGTDLVKVRPVIVQDVEEVETTTLGMEVEVPVSTLLTDSPATETTAGTVLQAEFVANGAVPYADLTAAANHVNSILASLQAAGIMASS
jgi:hypothetical protein